MRASKLVLAGSALLLVLAACSNDDSGEASGASPSPVEPASGGSEVIASDSAFGAILTDPDGNTLYVFENDADGESTCYDDCAANWPAFVTDGDPVAGAGVDAALLGATERTDATIQVTYADRPLYYFGGDQQPGDTNGQGVGDVWYMVSPAGEPVESEGESGEGESGGDEATGRQTEIEAEDSAFGAILTDSKGNTLYVFLNDADGESTCYDDCASNWPAFEAKGELAAGNGVDSSLLGTTERTDGTAQLSYNGHPLYYFAGDQAPGDTNGQGVGGVWYVVSPEGDPVEQ